MTTPTPTPAPAMTFAEAVIACAIWREQLPNDDWDDAISMARDLLVDEATLAIRAALAQGQGAAACQWSCSLPQGHGGMHHMGRDENYRTHSPEGCEIQVLKNDLTASQQRVAELTVERDQAQKRAEEWEGLWRKTDHRAYGLEQDRDALLAKCERLERESNTAGRRLEQLAAELAALQSAPKPARGMGERITASEASALIDAGWVPREAAIASHSDLFKEDGAECVDRRVNIWLAARQQGGAK